MGKNTDYREEIKNRLKINKDQSIPVLCKYSLILDFRKVICINEMYRSTKETPEKTANMLGMITCISSKFIYYEYINI
uniref:Uncharacterized protein n=1 Tax=Parascaris univalens TaxID=6257 RepID=A0A915BP71_PARUN